MKLKRCLAFFIILPLIFSPSFGVTAEAVTETYSQSVTNAKDNAQDPGDWLAAASGIVNIPDAGGTHGLQYSAGNIIVRTAGTSWNFRNNYVNQAGYTIYGNPDTAATWVTTGNDLTHFYDANGWGATNSDLIMFIERGLGMNTADGGTHDAIVEFTVAPNNSTLMRPTRNPDITTYNPDAYGDDPVLFPFQQPAGMSDDAYGHFKNYYEDWRTKSAPGQVNQFPWTQLGYTYFWGNAQNPPALLSDVQGMTEFILPGGTSANIYGIYATSSYIYTKNNGTILTDAEGSQYGNGFASFSVTGACNTLWAGAKFQAKTSLDAAASNTVTITSDGSVSGGQGILIGSQNYTVTNAGSITASTVSANSKKFNITGSEDIALLFKGDSATYVGAVKNILSNSGTITGPGVNGSAVVAWAGNTEITNTGTITGSGTGYAIQTGAGNDSVTADGGTITGNIDLGTGTDSLTVNIDGTVTGKILAGGTGTVTVDGGTLNLTGVSTYSGSTTVNGGTLTLQFDTTNNTGVMNSSSALTLGAESSLDVLGGATAIVNTQTFNGTTLSGGQAAVSLTKNTATSVTLNLGTLTNSTKAFINFTLPAGTSVTASHALDLSGALLGTWASVGSGTSLAYAASSNATNGSITSYTGATDATAADLSNMTSATTNYKYGAATTLAGNKTGNTLQYTGAAATTALGTNSLTLNGLMNSGTGLLTITGDASSPGLVTGAGGELDIVSNSQGITISSVISGAGAVVYGAVVYGGTQAGTLTLSGVNTYTGATTVNEGILQFAKEVSLYNNTPASWTAANIVVHSGATLAFNVGGAGEFTSSDIAILSNLGTAAGGFLDGSLIGLDTTNGDFSYSRNLADTNGGQNSLGLRKRGTGALSLSGDNTYTGEMLLAEGTLNINSATALGTGTFWIYSGTTLDNTSGGAVTLTNNNKQEWESDFTFTGTNDLNLGAGDVTIWKDMTVTVNNRNLTVGGSIGDDVGDGSEGFSLTKAGAGTLTLSGANTYTGATTVSAGVLNIRNEAALGTTDSGTSVTSGAALEIQGGIWVSEALTLNGTGVGATGALRNISEQNDWWGDITLGSATLINSDAGQLDLFGAITGAGQSLTLGGASHFGIYGVISTGALIKEGAGILMLDPWDGPNTYTGSTTINAGELRIYTGWSIPETSAVILADGAKLLLDTAYDPIDVTLGSLSGSGTVRLAADGTLTVGDASSTTYAGVISSTGHTGALTKTGSGTLILTGSNTYTGATTVNAGTMNLDFSAAGAPATNILSSDSALVLGGGTLLLTGKASTTNSQTVDGLTLNSGASAITLTAHATANPLLLNLGAITRNVGSTVNFTQPAGTLSSTNGIKTSTANTSGTILGGWATVGGTDWATNNGTNIVALASYENNTWSAAYNTTVTNNANVDGSATNSLRFNNAGAWTITLANTNTISSGGILVTSNVGNNLSTITGGTLRGAAGKDLVIFQNNTSNGLTISSAITDNTSATGLTKSGAGVLTLSGTNTYTGGLTLNEGTLNLNSTTALGGAASKFTINGGTLGNTSGGDMVLSNNNAIDIKGNFTYTATGVSLYLGAGAMTLFGDNTITVTTAGTTLGNTGIISGAFGLATAGAGTVSLGGANAYTGATTIGAGSTLSLTAGGAIATSSGVVNNGTFAIAASKTIQSLTGAGATTLGTLNTHILTIGEAVNDRSGTYSGIASGPGGITKAGTGTLTLSGANTYTGDTTVNAGTLTLQFNTANKTGVISSSSALTLGDTSTLSLLGGTVAETEVQTFNGTTLSGGQSTISLAQNSATSVTLNLGTLTNSTKSYINFTLPIGTSVTADNAASNGLLGTWASVGSGTSLKYAAKVDGDDGAITAYAGATSATAANLSNMASATTNYKYGAATALTGNQTGNTLQYTGAATTTELGTNSLTLNGLMNSGSGLLTITGTAGNAGLVTGAGGELDIIDNGSGITISSVISGAGAVVYGGPGAGTLILSGVNTYAGTTTINAGTLQVGDGGTSGNLGAGNVTNNAMLKFNRSDDLTVSNVISGSGNLYKNGAGTLTLSSSNTYTGRTYIGGGTVYLTAPQTTTWFTFVYGDDQSADENTLLKVAHGVNLTGDITNYGVERGTLTFEGSSIMNGRVGDYEDGGSLHQVNVGTAGSLVSFQKNIGAYEIHFTSTTTDGTITLADGVDYHALYGDAFITTEKDGLGILKFLGSSDVDATVGASDSYLHTLIADGTGTTVAFENEDCAVYVDHLNFSHNGTVQFAGAATLGDVDNTSGSTGGTLIFASDAEVGGIGATRALSAVRFGDGSTGGVVSMNGNINATTTTVDAGATLSLTGDRTISGGLTLKGAGILTLGANSLNIGGAYQDLGATLNLTINGVTTADYGNVVVGGTTTVQAGSQVYVTVPTGLTIASGTAFTIIDAAGDGGIVLPSVTSNTRRYAFTASKVGGDLILTSGGGFAAPAGATGNEASVGNALNSISGPTGDMSNVMDQLGGLSDSQYEASLDTMTPDVSAGPVDGTRVMTGNSFRMISNRLGGARNGGGVGSGVSSGDMMNGMGVWMQGLGSHVSQDTRQGIEGYKANIFGTMLGVDKLVDKHIRLGLAGGYGYAAVKSKTSGSPSDSINSWQGSIYGSFDSLDLNKARELGKNSRVAVRNQGENSWYVDGMIAFTQNNYDSRREIWVTPASRRLAKAEHYGQQYATNFEAGYTFNFAKTRALEVTPFASLGYNYLYMNRYKENGADSLDLSVRGEGFHQLEQGLGMKFAYPFEIERTGTFIPSIKGAWLYDYITSRYQTTASFAGGGSSFNTVGARPAKSGMLFGAELAFLNKGNMTVTGNWDIELKDQFMSNTYYGTVRYDF